MNEEKIKYLEEEIAWKKREMYNNSISKLQSLEQENSQMQDHLAQSSHKKSRQQDKDPQIVNKEKRDYKERFKQYLEQKERDPREWVEQTRLSRSTSKNRKLQFDRFEATSPNPVRVKKGYNVYFDDKDHNPDDDDCYDRQYETSNPHYGQSDYNYNNNDSDARSRSRSQTHQQKNVGDSSVNHRREPDRSNVRDSSHENLGRSGAKKAGSVRSNRSNRSFDRSSHNRTGGGPKKEGVSDHQKLEVSNWFWTRIDPNNKNATHYPKKRVLEFLMENPDIMQAFHQDQVTVPYLVQDLATEYQDMISKEEWNVFMLECERAGKHDKHPELQNLSEVEDSYSMHHSAVKEMPKSRNLSHVQDSLFPDQKTSHKQGNSNKECLLSEHCAGIMKDIYDKLDRYNDLVNNRQDLVALIQKDPRMKQYLNMGVVKLKNVEKEIPLRKILNQISEEEMLVIRNEIAKNGRDQFEQNKGFVNPKTFISWKQFLDYFTNYERNRDVGDCDLKFRTDNNDNQNEIISPSNLLDIMKSEFGKIENRDGFVNTLHFLDTCRQNDNIRQYMEITVRNGHKGLGEESLTNVLDRIQREGDDMMDWDEMIQYFTKRGRPVPVEGAKIGGGNITLNAAEIKGGKFFEDNNPYESIEKRKEKNIGNAGEKSRVQFADSGHRQEDGYKSGGNQNGGAPRFDSQVVGPGDCFNNNYSEYNRNFNQNPYAGNSNNQFQCPHDESSQGKSQQNFNQNNSGWSKSNPYHYETQNAKGQNRQASQKSRGREILPEELDQSKYIPYLETDQYLKDTSQYQPPEFEDDWININGRSKKIVIPESLGASQIDSKGKSTISRRKFDNYVSELMEKEDAEYNVRFKAKPIPKSTTEPKYQRLMHKEDSRREEVRKSSVALTKVNERPFSFYERDKSRTTKFKEDFRTEQKPFKTNPVPWFCSVELYNEKRDKEEHIRREKISKRAQENLALSKLPPRMEKHKQERKHQELLGGPSGYRDWNNECTFQPGLAKPVPDFERLQENFEAMLGKSKASRKPTKPAPFNFTDTSKTPKVDYLDLENDMRRKEVELRLMREKNEHNLMKMRKNMEGGSGGLNTTNFSQVTHPDRNSESTNQFSINATKKVLDHFELNRRKAIDKREQDKQKADQLDERKKREREIADDVRANIRHENAEHDAKMELSKEAKTWRTEKFPSDYKEKKVAWPEKVKEMDMKIKEKGTMLSRGRFLFSKKN